MKDEGTPEQGMNLSSPTPSPIEGAKAVQPDASWTGIQLVEYAKTLFETARKLEKQAGVVYWDSCDALRLAQEAFKKEGRRDWVKTVEGEFGPYSTVQQMIRVANALTRQQADGLSITEIKVRAGILFVKVLSDPGNGGDKPTRRRRSRTGQGQADDDEPDDGPEPDESDNDGAEPPDESDNDGAEPDKPNNDGAEPDEPDTPPGPNTPEPNALQVDVIALEQAKEVVASVADAVMSQPPLAEEARTALARVTELEKTVGRIYMALLQELVKAHA